MEDYEKYSLAFLTAVKKPAVILPAVGVASLTSCQLAIFFLLGLMAADFGTGVFASWVIWKNDPTKEGLKFIKHGISSDKIRLSLVKSVTYFMFIICAYGLEYIFKIKSFRAETYTDHQVTLTLIAIAIACAIEFYSIIFENLPKAGFSIESNVKKIYAVAKSVMSAIKNFKNGNNGPT